jgi:GDP-4-dehydro-6-deoxy-D-mannose reductase
MKTQRIFITGATGFVGRYLIAAINGKSAAGRVEIFGSCFPEKPESCSDLCAAAPNTRLVHLDLRDAAAALDAVKAVKPDRIYHLAALSRVRLSWEMRREVFETNLSGTYNLFEAARLHAPKARILFVSSSDVYGFLTPHKRALRETDGGSVVSPYAFTKKSGELLSEFYALREKLPVIVARPFPHTGPGQSPEFVCSDWARQVALIEKFREKNRNRETPSLTPLIPDSGSSKKKDPGAASGDVRRVPKKDGNREIEMVSPYSSANMPVMRVGNLSLRRDYMDVRDVVRAYGLLMRKGRPGEIYNVSSGRAPSMEWILKTLISFSKRKIAYEIDPDRVRKVDIPFLAGDNRKIQAETGWQAKIPLVRTLRDMLDYWRARV